MANKEISEKVMEAKGSRRYVYALMSHNDGTMQSGDCILFSDRASAYNGMLNDIRQELYEGKPMQNQDIQRQFEKDGGNLVHDSADIEYFGVTYEWQIQKCLLPVAENGINLEISTNDEPEFFGQIIDCFDDFLQEQDVRLPRSVKEMADDDETGDCNSARIYGSDYDDLNDKITKTVMNWSC